MKFTRENPFKFETRSYYLSGDAAYYAHNGALTYDTAAIHAIIEAERDEWHEDEAGFRKGRWFVSQASTWDHHWRVMHDDFPGSYWETGSADTTNKRTASAIRADFLAWHAANTQPEEPTGLGAVVEVGPDRYTRCDDGRLPWHGLPIRIWADWADLTKQGPVTVLSEGVTP